MLIFPTAIEGVKIDMTKAAKVPAKFEYQAKLWKIDKIIPYPNNARSHPASQVTLLASLFKAHGVDQPIVVDEAGMILKGHGRRLAAIEAEFAHFPVVQRFGLSEAEKIAIRLQDNQVALLSTWHPELIKAEITSLKATGFDLELLGFPVTQMEGFGIVMGTDQTAPEVIPERPAKSVTKPGDVWIMGNHRLICGDATDKESVAAVLAGAKPKLMVTDPPYGVKYDPTWRDSAGGIFGDGKAKMRGLVKNDDQANWTKAWELFGGDVAYVWCASLTSDQAIIGLEAAGFFRRCQIIWAKPHFQLSRGDYHWQHEPCWYVVRPGKPSRWQGLRNQSSVWQIAGMNPAGRTRSEGNELTGHGTQKPVECMKRPIENNSKKGDVIYEPFAGSFTTGIACEITGRSVRAVELDPAYVDVGVLRWQQFAQAAARLESTGKTFAEMAKVRKKTPPAAPLSIRKNAPKRARISSSK